MQACAFQAAPLAEAWLNPAAPCELEELRRQVESRVIGQGPGIAEIIACLARWRAGLAGLDGPVGAFLLLGPSGVGKTLTVETIAGALHGSSKAVLKLHCAELKGEHELARLKGSPPGYVGWRECVPLLHETRLREVRLREEPAVVLFDEVEKAHPALWDLLLGLLDKGEVVLNDNTRTDFKNTIVFLTGNSGAKEIAEQLSGGTGFRPATGLDVAHIARRASERLFSPEFRNRLTATITYRPLTRDQLYQIARNELEQLAARLRARHSLLLRVDDDAIDAIVRAGCEAQYGARHLKRAVQRLLENPLANLIAGGRVKAGDCVRACTRTGGEVLHFRMENRVE